MSPALFTRTLKANWLLAAVFTVIVLIYVTTSLSMFNPRTAEDLESMIELLPEGLTRAMGFVNLGTDLTMYLANYLFGFIMIIFPMIYVIILANRLIARHVDSGAMAYLLTTPNTRSRIATTQAFYLAVSLAVIFLIASGVAIVLASAMFPGHLDVGAYLGLNWVSYLSLLTAGGVSFFSSCSFNESRQSLAVGASVPVLFFVFRMVSALGDELSWLQYLSVYSFIDVDRIVNEASFILLVTAVQLPLAILLFTGGIIRFARRSLPL